MRGCVAVTAVALVCALSAGALCQGVAINHTCTDATRVPPEAIRKARDTFRVAYGHTSHGSQIVSGMDALRRADAALFGYGPRAGAGTLLLRDATPGGDLGNPDRTTWAQRTRDFLRGPGKDTNLVMWSWCGQVSSASQKDIETYLALMSGLEKEFPGVAFVYMTGHLDGSGANGNLNRRNEQIREFCRKNGKVLFDFADIESYDPDGRVNYMELRANDACNYQAEGGTRNWAADWARRNPGKIALPDRAAHSHPLNAALKGRAFWWMLARLAGWTPPTD